MITTNPALIRAGSEAKNKNNQYDHNNIVISLSYTWVQYNNAALSLCAGHVAPDQPSVLLPGPVVLPLQHGRHHVQLDGRHFRHVPVAAGRERPRAVLPLAVQPQRVPRADRVAAERDAAAGRHHRALRGAQRLAVRAPRVVPVVRHGHGQQGRDVLQPGDPRHGGLLELETRFRAGHAGRAGHGRRAAGRDELPERSESGQGTGAARVGAQQRVAQVPVRQDEPDRRQLPRDGGAHGRRGQRYGLRGQLTAAADVYRNIDNRRPSSVAK